MDDHVSLNQYELILLELGLVEDEVLSRLNNPDHPENSEGRACCWHVYLSTHVKSSWLSFGISERLELMLAGEREARRHRSDCCYRSNDQPLNEACANCMKFQILKKPQAEAASFHSESINTLTMLESVFQGNMKGLLRACNALTMALSYVDLQQRYLFVNKSYRATFGLTNADVLGKRIEEIVGKDVSQQTHHHLEKCLAGHVLTYTQRRIKADGAMADYEILTIPHYDEEGEVVGAFGILSETGIVDSQYHAKHDILTGLGNRYRLYEMIKYYQRYNPDFHQIYLVVLDLNRFRNINDSLGHSAGDFVLQEMGRRIVDVVEDPEHVFRLGGDEFAFIHLGRHISCKETKALTRRLKMKLAQPIYTRGREVSLDATFGIAQINSPESCDPTKIVNLADIAMDYAARTDKPCLCYCDEMFDEMAGRSDMEMQLKWALRNQEIIPYFQPILDLKDRSILGYEALARWIKADGSMVSPGAFIPVAEQCGLMDELTDQILCQSIEKINQLNELRDPDQAPLYVSVNISPSTLRDQSLFEKLEVMLMNRVFEPEHLLLEITEEVSSRAQQRMLDLVKQVRSLGIRFACDDFGTGYSSLSKLSEMPWDILKIDRSFLIQERANLMLEPIVMIASRLGVSVVIEGIEDPSQEEMVIGLGCDYAQGFLYSKPVPFEALSNNLN